jgi:cell division protein FtsB
MSELERKFKAKIRKVSNKSLGITLPKTTFHDADYNRSVEVTIKFLDEEPNYDEFNKQIGVGYDEGRSRALHHLMRTCYHTSITAVGLKTGYNYIKLLETKTSDFYDIYNIFRMKIIKDKYEEVPDTLNLEETKEEKQIKELETSINDINKQIEERQEKDKEVRNKIIDLSKDYRYRDVIVDLSNKMEMSKDYWLEQYPKEQYLHNYEFAINKQFLRDYNGGIEAFKNCFNPLITKSEQYRENINNLSKEKEVKQQEIKQLKGDEELTKEQILQKYLSSYAKKYGRDDVHFLYKSAEYDVRENITQKAVEKFTEISQTQSEQRLLYKQQNLKKKTKK